MSTTTPRPAPEPSLPVVPQTDRVDAVQLTDLHKSFGDVTAVDGVDLTISPGEVVALLGPNGAGKTTTIDMIPGLSRPTSGEVRVFGMSPRQAVNRGLIAAVMQTAGLLPDITVRETVELTASLFSHKIDTEEAMRRAGVTDFATRIVKKCSGGQQQRLRFAMALVSDPALLILDEPTTGMDVEGRRSFWEAIHADAEHGRTIVFATHYLEEADAFADRIILMSRGRIVADGTATEIRASVSGRSLRATLTCAAEQLHDALADLRAQGTVSDVEILGSALTLSSTDTDAVAALLLDKHLAKDLEITSRGLEEAFMALTSDDTTVPTPEASA